jgi:hypothetical protein
MHVAVQRRGDDYEQVFRVKVAVGLTDRLR